MTDISKHIRIFNSSPDDDFVNKRIAAVTAIENIIKKKSSLKDIMGFANDLILAVESPDQGSDSINIIAEPALKKQSTSFIADGEHLQVLTCTLLATIKYLEKFKVKNNNYYPEIILALSLLNGLSFQSPLADKEKLEALRMELLELSTQIISKVANISRKRFPAERREALSIPSDNTFATHVSNVNNSDGKLIEALQINSILDREEINILWWVLGGWSSICKCTMSSLSNSQAPIISAFEISSMLSRIPTDAHIHLACRITGVDSLDSSEVKNVLGESIIQALSNYILQTDIVKNNTAIFPVFSSLSSINEISETDSKYSLEIWAGKILMEGALLNADKLFD